MKDNMKKLTFALLLLASCAFGFYLFDHKKPTIGDLQLTFSLDDTLKIEVCNPTNKDIHFYDGLGFGSQTTDLYSHTFSLEYEIYRSEFPRRSTDAFRGPLLGPFDFHSPIKKIMLSPKTCLLKNADIRHLLNAIGSHNATFFYNDKEHEYNDRLQNETITGFRIRINLYDTYSKNGKRTGQFFDSQWFDISKSQKD